MLPSAEVSGHTTATIDGTISSSQSVLVHAVGQNRARADVDILQIAIGGLSGAYAHAEVTSGAAIEAIVGAGASLASSGHVQVTADIQGGGRNEAIATTELFTGGAFNVGVMVANAEFGGALRAKLDGTVTGSAQVTVKAIGSNYAEARNDAIVVGGLAGLSASVVNAEITSSADVEALAEDADNNDAITSSGIVEFNAQSTNTAKGFTNVGAGGILAVNVTVPTAAVNGATRAELQSNVSNASAVNVKANSTNTADVTSDTLSIGLIAAAVSVADASVGTAATTNAVVGANSTIDVPGAAVLVQSQSANHTFARTEGDGGGLATSRCS